MSFPAGIQLFGNRTLNKWKLNHFSYKFFISLFTSQTNDNFLRQSTNLKDSVHFSYARHIFFPFPGRLMAYFKLVVLFDGHQNKLENLLPSLSNGTPLTQ